MNQHAVCANRPKKWLRSCQL